MSEKRVHIADLPMDIIMKFREDPVLFAEMCGWKLWDKQKEILYSVRDNKWTAVVSIFGVGKTFIAARAAAWFLNVYMPSIVYVIAPVLQQVKDLFWKEFRTAYEESEIELMGKPKLVPHMEILPNHYIRGYIAREEQTKGSIIDKMTGYHEENMLIVCDQADGLHTDVFTASSAVLTSLNNHFLGLTNATNSDSEIAQIIIPERKTKFGLKYVNENNEVKPINGRGWNVIRIAAEDTPNVKAKKEVHPKLFTYEKYLELNETLDENDPMRDMFLRAIYAEGTSMTVLTERMVKEIFEINEVAPDFSRIKVGIDIADEGKDRTVWHIMAGGRLLFIDSVVGHNSIEVLEYCGVIEDKVKEFTSGAKVSEWNVDALGLGKNIYDRMAYMGYPATPIFAGEAIDDLYEKKVYANRRAEINFFVRDLAQRKRMSMKPLYPTEGRELERLKDECLKVRYKFLDGSGKMQILEKKKLRKLFGRSPDNWDALTYCVYPYSDVPLGEIAEPEEEVPDFYGESVRNDNDPFNFDISTMTDDELEERFFGG